MGRLRDFRPIRYLSLVAFSHIEFTFEDSLHLEMFSLMCAVSSRSQRVDWSHGKEIAAGLRGWSPAIPTRMLQLLQVKKRTFMFAISTTETRATKN